MDWGEVVMKTDAELMTSYMPAEEIVVVPKKFTAYRDKSAHPAVVFLDDQGLLHVVGEKEGTRQRGNLSQAYGISSATVDFVLRQAEDGTISLAVATLGGLHLYFGLAVDEIWSPPSSKLVKGDNLPGMAKVFMTHTTSSIDGLGDVPSLLFSRVDSQRVNETTVSPIIVTQDGNGNHILDVDKNWKLNTNATEIHDIGFGSSAFGVGAFVLYTDHESKKRVIYQVTEPDDSSSDSSTDSESGDSAPFLCDFYVDDDTTHIVNYIDPTDKRRSVLLTIGSKISVYLSDQYVRRKPKKAAVATISTLIDVKTIHVAQSTDKNYTDHITIWYVNKQGAAYYYRTTHADFEKGSSVQILPRGSCDQISATLWELSEQGTLVQTLVSFNEQNGKYDIWHQGLNTGFWDRHPMFVDKRTTNMEVQGYAARFQPVSLEGDKFPNSEVHLYLNSTSLIYIHGKPEWVGLEGKWVQTDTTGTLEIFVPADQLDGHSVFIDSVRQNSTAKELNVLMAWEHLCEKPAAKLRNYQTVDQLRKAKTQSGKQIIPDSMSSDLISQLSDGISMGFKVHDDLAAGDSVAQAAITTREEHVRLMKKSVQFSSSCVEDLKNLVNMVRDGWNWAWGKIKKLGEGIWQVVVEIAGQSLKFIIDSVKKALHFISKVIDAIKLFIETLIDWVGMIFHWGDIKTTAESIHRWLDASLYWGAAKADSLETLTDGIFENIIDQLGSMRGTQLTQSSDPPKDPGGFEDLTHGVQFNYGISKLLKFASSSSSSAAMNIKLASSPETINAADLDIVKVVWDALTNILEDMKNLFRSVFKDVTDWNEWAKSPLEVLKRLDSDIAIGIVKLVRDAVEAMIKAVATIIRNFQSWGNWTLDIPILSPLWHKITGQELSIFGAFSFVMAFPTYLIAKAITGKAPPDLSNMPIDEWMNASSFNATSSLSAHESSRDLRDFLGFSGVAVGVITPAVFLVVKNLDLIKAIKAYEIKPGLNLLDLILLSLSTLTALSPIALGFKAEGKVQPFWPKMSWISDLASAGIYGSCIVCRYYLGGSVPHEMLSIVVDTSNLFIGAIGTVAKVFIIKEEWTQIDGYVRGAEILSTALVLAGNGAAVAADIFDEAEQGEIGIPIAVAGVGLKLAAALTVGYKVFHDHEP